MRNLHFALAGLVALTGLVVVGCGGGGSGPSAPPGEVTGQQVFVVDFVHNTVTVAVQPQYVDDTPGAAAADLKVVLTVQTTRLGNPGARLLQAKVTNNLPGVAGRTKLGAVTGIDLCLVNTIFRDAATNPVAGGGYADPDALDPLTGTPVYTLAQSLAAGATSPAKQIDVLLPVTATTAVITMLARAHLGRALPPALGHWYLSTVAGLTGIPSYVDGPVGSALFNSSQGLLFRDNVGDLLVADLGNNRIRRVYNGQVTTFAGNGLAAVCGTPFDLAPDGAGNVVICELIGYCISLAPPGGGAPTVIAGLRGTSGDLPAVGGTADGSVARFNLPESLAVVGNVIYVADSGNHKLKIITYDGVGDRFDPLSYSVTSAAVPFLGNFYLTADGRGALYAADWVGYKVFRRAPGGSAWAVIAGTGVNATVDGTGATAQFKGPAGIAADSSGVVYVAEQGGALRRLWLAGSDPSLPANWQVRTLAPDGASPVDGKAGTGKLGALTGRPGISRDGVIYVVDGNSVRRLDRTRS